MKRGSTRTQSVLEHQAVSRRGRRNRPHLALRALRPFCKGLMKVTLATVILAVVSFLFLSMYHYFLTSPYLRLHHVVIEGVGQPLKHQLLKMSGLSPNVSLLALNLNVLKRKLEKDPWIRSIEVEREFPNTLVIKAEKEDPWAILLCDGMYYVNHYGQVFKKVGASEGMDFPLITGIRLGDRNWRDELDEATRVMDELDREKSPWCLGNLAEIHVENGYGCTLYFEGFDAGIKINSRSLQSEVPELRRVVAHLTEIGKIGDVTTIDFNYADGAVVSFREG